PFGERAAGIKFEQHGCMVLIQVALGFLGRNTVRLSYDRRNFPVEGTVRNAGKSKRHLSTFHLRVSLKQVTITKGCTLRKRYWRRFEPSVRSRSPKHEAYMSVLCVRRLE